MANEKELVEEMQKTVHDFREYVEKEKGEIKKIGVPNPETTETIKRLNDRIDELQVKISRPPVADPKAEESEALREQTLYLRKGWNGMSEAGRIKAMSVGSDADGGYFVTPDTSGRIIQKIFDTTPMRQLASVVSISTDELTGPIDRDEVASGWAGETTSRTAGTDTPEVGRWRIPVFEQYANPKMTQQLLDDAKFDVGGFLEGKVADYLARQENAAFVTGNGVTKPRGITMYTTAATADATRTWGQIEHVVTGSAGDWTAANIDKLFDLETALNPGYRQGASFLGPKSVILKVRKFKLGDGQYIWQPGLQAGKASQLIGYPYMESEDMPAIASASLSLAFGNFREAYTIVDRQGIRVLRDPYTAKPYVLFYTTKRVGGAVLCFDALKFLKFSA